MNGEKGMLAEGGIRVPFLVSWPGVIPGNQVIDTPWYRWTSPPTAVALSGLPADPSLDGRNIVPFLSGNDKAPQRALYWRWIAQSALRDGKWKLLRGGQRDYLFNLDEDPGEKHNLIAQQPELATRLIKQLETWAADMQPPGLNTQAMSTTWESYFDHYLDGKTVAAPSKETPGRQGWIARNSRASLTKGALRVKQEKGARQQAFIACAKLNISGPTKASITLRAERDGEAGFAWRLKGQDDFVTGQSVVASVTAGDWQVVELDLPASGTIIHLRVLLPNGTTDIRKISFKEKIMDLRLNRRLVTAFLLVATCLAHAAKKTNVVFILADDLGWSDTTLYGTTSLYQTPQLERLAKSGVTFTHAYAASPLCSPTRASILTGLNPARIGITAPSCHTPTVLLKAGVQAKAKPDTKALICKKRDPL